MHIPVLLKETVEALAVKPGGRYIDGTLGRAGHASAILRLAGADGWLLGIDRDVEAFPRAAAVLAEAPGHAVLVHGTHGELAALAAEKGFDAVDGILLDLGVSSDQLDTPGRGFSFQADGPLDMRMDQTRGESARELIARESEAALADLFR
ncbi:MAG: 16S rRNA (cytosine(1402)-N(4))-methyltransferase, partial [Kiritimatiellae bacterium]|nr:16S rRNA (cytosine(1402)-N(4))-methyltransferase [Kiritimatiellia bacterium]